MSVAIGSHGPVPSSRLSRNRGCGPEVRQRELPFRGRWPSLLYVHQPGVASGLELLGELRGHGAIGCPPLPRLAGV